MLHELFRILRDLIKGRVSPAEIPPFIFWLLFREDQIKKEEEDGDNPWPHVEERKAIEQQLQQ